MGYPERFQTGGVPVGELRGESLDQVFGNNISWLRRVAFDPLSPRKIHRFSGGHLYCADLERLIFEVCLTEGPTYTNSEFYTIDAGRGLISFKRISNVSEVDSSILGRLQLDQGPVSRILEERQALLVGLDPMKDEREEVREERKRAAIKVVRRCRGIENN